MKIPLGPLFEKAFGLKEVDSKEQLLEIIKELEKDPDGIVDLSKFDDSEKQAVE